jgi:hypothetical protein
MFYFNSSFEREARKTTPLAGFYKNPAFGGGFTTSCPSLYYK